MTRLLVLTGLIAALATPAFAQREESRTQQVQYHDLDLSTAAGIARFDRRIATAVDAVCGQVQADRQMAGSIQRCRQAAFAAAAMQRGFALAHPGTDRAVRVAGAR